MKKMLVKILILFSLFFQIQFVNAEVCSESKINSLKKLANLILIDSEFDYDSVVYGVYDSNIVTIQNLPDNLYIMSKNGDIGFFTEDIIDGVISDIVPSSSNIFFIYSSECDDVILRTIKLDLKKFNMYSTYEECDGIEEGELEVCNEFSDVNLNYEGFQKKVSDYKDKYKLLPQKIEDDISQYYPFIVLSVILIIGVIIILIIRVRKRNKLD